MSRLHSPWLLASLLACQPTGSGTVPTDGVPTDTGEAPTGDTGPTGPTTPAEPVAFSGVTAALDPRLGTVIRVSWTQSTDATVHLEFSVDPGEWLTSPPRALAAGAHEELALGVPYASTVTWRLVGENDAGVVQTDDATLDTAPTPPTLPVTQVNPGDPSGWDPAMPYVLASLTEVGGDFGDPWWVVVLDRRGRVVWGRRTPSDKITMHARIALDGRSLLLDDNSYWGRFDQGVTSTITRMTLDGTVIETWDAPGLHHDFVDLPDGTLIYGAYQGFYSNELLVEIAPDRSTRVIFDCEAWLAEVGEDRWCGSNTVTWRASDDTLLWSMFSFETILEIDRATGAVDRWFGNLPGSYAFDPPESRFWYQHGGYWTDAGTLLTSTHLTEAGVETVVREYAVDDAARTLREVWSFGVGDGVYGAQMGEAHLLPSGNVLHNYGTLARLREGRRDGSVVWDVQWPGHDIGRSIPVADLYALAGERD